jgi:hypothetical protein
LKNPKRRRARPIGAGDGAQGFRRTAHTSAERLKAKHTLTPEEQRKRFEEEVRKRTADGDFDHDAAGEALEKLVRDSRKKSP